MKKVITFAFVAALSFGCPVGQLAAQQGIWPGFPVVGQSGSGVASWGATGSEHIPLDTEVTQGAYPESAVIPLGMLAPGSVFQGGYPAPKNLFRNGDISVNPFQSGTSLTGITNTVTTGADGFRFVGGSSSSISTSQQTGSTDVVAGQFTASVRFQRASSNANTAQVCQISVLPIQDSVPLIGHNFVYSFWAKPGANFSPTNGAIVVSVSYGTGSTNQTSANFGPTQSWTNQTNVINTAGSYSGTFTGTVSSSQATFNTLPSGSTATWMQYWVAGTVPTATTAGTAVTQVGTSICWTPVGTAGTNDWIETSNHQLEVAYGGMVTPTAFEHHTAQQDLSAAQRFLYVITEGTPKTARGLCRSRSTTTCSWDVVNPTTMRAAPAISLANGFAVETTAAGGTLNNCTLTADTTVTSTVASPNHAYVLCTATTVPAAGTVDQVYDNGGTGSVTLSSEL